MPLYFIVTNYHNPATCHLCGAVRDYDAGKDIWWCPLCDNTPPGLTPIEDELRSNVPFEEGF